MGAFDAGDCFDSVSADDMNVEMQVPDNASQAHPKRENISVP